MSQGRKYVGTGQKARDERAASAATEAAKNASQESYVNPNDPNATGLANLMKRRKKPITAADGAEALAKAAK